MVFVVTDLLVNKNVRQNLDFVIIEETWENADEFNLINLRYLSADVNRYGDIYI